MDMMDRMELVVEQEGLEKQMEEICKRLDNGLEKIQAKLPVPPKKWEEVWLELLATYETVYDKWFAIDLLLDA